MITEQELFDMGWKRFGDEKDDPYYKIFLERLVFDLTELSGYLTDNGNFFINKIPHVSFNHIYDITELFEVNGFQIDWYLMERYGTDELREGYDVVSNFLKEIKDLYKKYNLSIAHEDNQGAFIIEPFRQDNLDWIQAAMIKTEE